MGGKKTTTYDFIYTNILEQLYLQGMKENLWFPRVECGN